MIVITSPRNGIAEWKWDAHVKNDTFTGRSMQIKNKNSLTPVDLTGIQTIVFTFKLTYDGATALTINNTNTTPLITVTDAVNGRFTIGAGIISIDAGVYLYDATFTYSDGTVKTYFKGTWEILQNV